MTTTTKKTAATKKAAPAKKAAAKQAAPAVDSKMLYGKDKIRKRAGGGGGKGQAILQTMADHPEWSRKQVAEHVGCTIGRVGECARAVAGGWASLPEVAAPQRRARGARKQS